MTDNQFTALHFMLAGIANDLSAILGLLEKQQARQDGERASVTAHKDQVDAYAARVAAVTSQYSAHGPEVVQIGKDS